MGGHFEIVTKRDLVPSVRIDLADHPDALALLREKGWIGGEADRAQPSRFPTFSA